MGKKPCCDSSVVKRGQWSSDEDNRLKSYIDMHGIDCGWVTLPQKAGLKRCGKSCRLRWLNYLRPGIKQGSFTEEEKKKIYDLYSLIGSRWSLIATQLPGRTDNDIKNFWNTTLKYKWLENASNDIFSGDSSSYSSISFTSGSTFPSSSSSSSTSFSFGSNNDGDTFSFGCCSSMPSSYFTSSEIVSHPHPSALASSSSSMEIPCNMKESFLASNIDLLSIDSHITENAPSNTKNISVSEMELSSLDSHPYDSYPLTGNVTSCDVEQILPKILVVPPLSHNSEQSESPMSFNNIINPTFPYEDTSSEYPSCSFSMEQALEPFQGHTNPLQCDFKNLPEFDFYEQFPELQLLTDYPTFKGDSSI